LPNPCTIEAATVPEDAGELYRKAADLHSVGEYERALPLFRRALDLAEARHGKDSPRLALDLNNLGEVYRLLGCREEAEPLFEHAIALVRRDGGGHRRGLASSLNNLALLYWDQGRLVEAVPLQEQAIAEFESTLGPGHPNVVKARSNLAALHGALGGPERKQPPPNRAAGLDGNVRGPEGLASNRSGHGPGVGGTVSAPSGLIEIELPGGVRVRIPGAADPATVEAVLRALAGS
jgi:tetratricopeptide (TPR) repeat protein